ncbi:MAG TPA: hypothetical protein PLO86_05410, partial [Syntrophales bacterium]|nr:hypothetical protein [Syntrophales bacterium]
MKGSSILPSGNIHADLYGRCVAEGKCPARLMGWVILLQFVLMLMHPVDGWCVQPAVAGGMAYTIALKNNGTVWAWGHNNDGQLGDDTATDRWTPVQVKGPGGIGFLDDVTAIAAGHDHTAALKDDGTVWTWGKNHLGQLGDNTTEDRQSPVQVKGPGGTGFPDDVTDVAAGLDHTVALKDDGTVWAWGGNGSGQLGDNTTTARNTPVQVVGPGGVGLLTGVRAVATRYRHTVVLKNDGTVWAWGDN